MEVFNLNFIVSEIVKAEKSSERKDWIIDYDAFEGQLYNLLLDGLKNRSIQAYDRNTCTPIPIFGFEKAFFTTKYDINSFLKSENLPCRFDDNPKPEPKAELVADQGATNNLIGNANQNNAKKNSYTRRKTSFDNWLNESKVNIFALDVETIFNQVKLTDPVLWKICLKTFRRDFWQSYSRENDLKKQPGRPPKNI